MDRVFKAWRDAERMKGWWGPNGFTTPVCRIDARPGGIFHSCMRSPDESLDRLATSLAKA